jgi:hypothetical protein
LCHSEANEHVSGCYGRDLQATKRHHCRELWPSALPRTRQVSCVTRNTACQLSAVDASSAGIKT